MAEIHDFSVTDASNTARWPEGMAPSAVNNAGRADEGLIARYYFDNDSSVVATLSGSVIQMTLNRVSLTQTGTTSNYIANLLLMFTMGSVTSTGNNSININSIGPISLRDNKGVSLSSSVLLANMRVLIVKDNANNYFRLLYPPEYDPAAFGTLAGTNLWTGSNAGTPSTITDAATFTTNFSAANNFAVKLGGNRTVEAQNMATTVGQSGVLRVQQDSVGGRTLTFGSGWDTAISITLATAASAFNLIAYYVYQTATVWASKSK